MPKMISNWQFKSRIEDVDLARIFAEAPADARVLRIIVGNDRVLAIRQAVYDAAMAADVVRPYTAAGDYWSPKGGLSQWEGSVTRTGWIFSVALLSLEHQGVSVASVLDWLARADEWHKAQVKTIVEAY